MLPFFALLCISPIVVVAILSVDELVELERTLVPGQWTADRMPSPMLRRSTATSFTISSMFATTRCGLTWMYRTPEWARRDARAMRLLRRLRALLLFWTFVGVPLFVIAVILSF